MVHVRLVRPIYSNIGALTENYVAQALACNGIPLYYWRNDNTAEVDFIVQRGDEIVPIEVKKGLNVRSRSLNQYIQTYHPREFYRSSQKNFGKSEGIIAMPLYAVFCL